MRRSAAQELRWCVTAYPCEAFAQDADMSLAEYEDFVFRAGWLHLPDPVAAWRGFAEQQAPIADWLSTACATLRVRRREDTDLTVGVAGRKWINCDGKRNFPDGEVFTGPIEDRDRGRRALLASPPSTAAARSRTFGCGSKAGGWSRPRRPRARSSAAADARPGRRRVASWASSPSAPTTPSQRLHASNMLFDEKIGGTFHMAVGAGYPETRRHEPLRPALGHGLRPALGRRDPRRRRADLPRRPVPAGVRARPVAATGLTGVRAGRRRRAARPWSPPAP